jgi:hypothetical protein
MNRRGLLAALIAAGAAFALYRATLLPGVDLGDTGSFQTMVGSAMITPRDAYPLYFAIGTAILWLTKAPPANVLNLTSAIEAAAACGLTVLVAVELSGSIAAALGVTLLFAASYTFWSQAIIAEVYSLHIALLALTLLLVLHFEKQPTRGRLFAFFAVFALGFGNHLSMILLLPGYSIFLLMTAPRGWRSMFAPPVVVMAVACAAAGALQYAWNLRTLWLLPDPPHGIGEALQRFWFDVTKSDWRDTMVLTVPQSRLGDHLAMYWFDLRQQFGLVAPAIAVVGLVRLASVNRKQAVLLLTLFAVNVAFAYSYNVGDAHVFYLPSHFILALLMAPALAWAGHFASRGAAIAGTLLAVYAATRAYHDFPALDRSHDTRPSAVVNALTEGLDDQRDILLTDLNWQIGNGLSYVAEVERPRVAYARLADVLLYAPALVADNRAIGRRIAVTERARTTLVAAYGPMFDISPDDRVQAPRFSDTVRAVRPGTRYVLSVLKPSGDLPLDATDLSRALTAITGGAAPALPHVDYLAVAGIAGQAPTLIVGSDRPFQRELMLQGVRVEIRMESWLVSDTIRRMGFGHVVAQRQHTLIVERGVSFVAFDDRGAALHTEYASNIYAPQPRYLIDSRYR